MIELKNRATEKKLTLQHLFRKADTHNRNKISLDEFKRTLQQEEIVLRQFTLKELELLLCDHKTQQISYTVYVETLLAFGVLVQIEEHQDVIRAFKIQVPMRVCEALLKRGLERPHIEAFCRILDGSQIKQKDLKRLLQGIQDEILTEREIIYYIRDLSHKGSDYIAKEKLWAHLEKYQAIMIDGPFKAGEGTNEKRIVNDLVSSFIIQKECPKSRMEDFLAYLRSFPEAKLFIQSDFQKMLEEDLLLSARYARHIVQKITSRNGEISIAVAYYFLKAHAYSRPSKAFLSEKELSRRIPGWVSMGPEKKGEEILKIIKRKLMLTHFTPEDVIEVAIVDSVDGIVTHNLVISTLVKLFGRYSPETLHFAFPQGNEAIDAGIFKDKIKNSENYKHPVVFNKTFKLPPRYISSFNDIADLKRTLASLPFDLY